MVTVRPFVKIIVEGTGDQWKAWFKDAPQVMFAAEWPTAAIERLIEHFDERNFDSDSIITVDDETSDGHLVFMVAMREMIRIPVPSVN